LVGRRYFVVIDKQFVKFHVNAFEQKQKVEDLAIAGTNGQKINEKLYLSITDGVSKILRGHSTE
jgi:hypothetical protein